MPDFKSYIQKLLVTTPMREPVIKQAIKELQLPKGSRGLDVGCGVGMLALQLAKAVGKDGHIVGLDISPEFLTYGEKIIKETDFATQITFKKGSMFDIPFEDDSFDWLWSVDCAGYSESNPARLMRELIRVVKPGGTIAILMYSYQHLLPGYPILEARLNATATGVAPFRRGMKPETHYLRSLGWFRDAGLQAVHVRTLIANFYAPLKTEIKEGLLALIEMRWGDAQSEVSKEDWELFEKLTNPKSPDLILNLPDYYAFFTYSMFYGMVAED